MAPKRNYFKSKGKVETKEDSKLKDNSQEQQNTTKDQGMISELPVLTYADNKPNNYLIFKEKLSIYLCQRHGDVGLFIESGELWTAPMPDEPEAAFDPDDRRSVSDWNEYDHARKRRVELQERAIATQTVMYHTIYGNLSTASKQKLKRSEQWAIVEDDLDPLALWNLITETHLVSRTGNDFLDFDRAITDYNRLQQHQKESLDSYYERFNHSIDGLVALVHPELPGNASRVSHFIRTLNRHYAEWRTSLTNNIRSGVANPPQTIAEAYALASAYTPIVDRVQDEQVGSRTAFVTESASDKKSAERKTRSGSDKANQSAYAPGAGQTANASRSKSKGSLSDNAGKEEKSSESKGSKPMFCHICASSEHFAAGCPFKLKVQKLISENKIVAFTSTSSVDDSRANWIMLDTEANVNIFKSRSLLNNIREAEVDVNIVGINGEFVKAHLIGEVQPFGSVYFSEEAIGNILSWHLMSKHLTIDWNQANDCITLISPDGEEFNFHPVDGLYICKLNEKEATALVNTVSANESLYNARELTMAKEAKLLIRRLGYPTSSDAVRLINRGGIINCPVTSRDVERAVSIYGKELASIHGKTVQRPSTIIESEPFRHNVPSEQSLHVDIMFINNVPFLLSVSKPLNLLQVADAATSRNSSTIRVGMENHIRTLESHGYKVMCIHSDGERAISAVADIMASRGVSFNPAGPGQHV